MLKRFVGGRHVDMKVSKLLYVLQNDVEKVSTDRLERFIAKRFEEFSPTPLEENISFIVRNYVTIGDYIAFKEATGVHFGQVLKFRKFVPNQQRPSAREKNFKFWTFHFDMNANVEYLLYPNFKVSENGSFDETNLTTWFRLNDYIGTINAAHINFQKQTLPMSVINNF